MSPPLWPQYRPPLATAHGLWGGDLTHPRGYAIGHLEAWQTCQVFQTALRVPPAVSPGLFCGSQDAG